MGPLLGAPFGVAALLLAAAGALVLAFSAGINGTSPGGRYTDPLASVLARAGVEGAPQAGVAYGWGRLSQEGWAYRSLVARLERAARAPRLSLRVLGQVRYAEETYPLVLLSVGTASGAPPQVRVLLTGSVHGNETAGAEALVRLAELLARRPETYATVAFDIVPVVNPWGWIHGVRQNGAGKDINRDFASSRTQEAVLIRRFVDERIASNGPYDVALDHHETTRMGYFVYQYVARRSGLGSAFARTVQGAGKPLEVGYREGGFTVRGGVLRIPAIILPSVRALGRLSLEQYLRMSRTRQAYTLESPLADPYVDRVRLHGEAARAMLGEYLRRRDLPIEGGLVPTR